MEESNLVEEESAEAPSEEVQAIEETVEIADENAAEENEINGADIPLEESLAYEGDNTAEVVEVDNTQEVEELPENTTNEEAEIVEDGLAEEQQDGGFAA